MQKLKTRSRGGRPSQALAEQLDERLLQTATELFLNKGYGDTSIEMIAKKAGISKRTFYDRYADKSEIFATVTRRLIDHMRPKGKVHLFDEGSLSEILHRLAQIILRAALGKDAVALQRLMLAEAGRFPELALIMEKQGARNEAIQLIASLLKKETLAGNIKVADPHFAAEQFLQMVISVPQRRAMGLGDGMTPAEYERWGRDAVEFFLHACRAD
jgi:AcrR family transcriptional regulator